MTGLAEYWEAVTTATEPKRAAHVESFMIRDASEDASRLFLPEIHYE